MASAASDPSTLRQIGPFCLDAAAPALTLEGRPVALGQRATAILALLVQSARQYVPKRRIIEAVWPGMVVAENNLAVQISAIRRVLAQAPGGERWLETLPRRGYRFVGPVDDPTEQTAPVLPARAPRSTLPAPLTSFVGRERELAEIVPLLSRTRPLTLIGSGGTGKTRLALRVAAEVADAHPDGVWLAELAPLSDPQLVPQSVAAALGVSEGPGRSPLQALTEHLAASRVLVVLDNAEHLLAACARFADELLRRCARVVLLVTSRERLGIAGELTYRVPSLSMPDPKRDATPELLAACESVRLFVDRAQFQQPRFAVTRDNASAIASVCRRLDGIPLAIELAAARLRSMSVDELDSRLDQRFQVLTGGSNTALPRHQTLRSLIDWSYDLLSAKERALFQRLGVFAGGWTLEAAERICVGVPVGETEILDLLTSLVDKSLAATDEQGGATRYRLPETVRQYACDRLAESGGEANWRGRHFARFLELAVEAEPRLRGPDQQRWLDRLAAEHGNLRAAVAWCIDAGGPSEDALRFTGALWRYWYVRGFLEEGRRYLGAALAIASDRKATATRAKALYGAGGLARRQGDYAAARALHDEGLAIERERGDARGVSSALNALGIVAYEQGDFAAARALYGEALALRREQGDAWGIAVSLNNMGIVVRHGADLPAARALHEESRAIFRDLDDQQGMALASCNLGYVACEEGDAGAARALCEEGVRAFRGLGDLWGVAWSLEGLADAAFASGAPEAAVRLWSGADRLRGEIGCPLPPSERPRHDRRFAAARAAIGAGPAFDRAWNEGRAMPLETLLDRALAR